MPLEAQVLCALGVAAAVVFVCVLKRVNRKPKSDSSTQTPSVAIAEREYRPFKLVKKTDVSHNTIQFRFALQTASTRLGLPVGKHFLLRFNDDEGKAVSRPYTPVTSDDDLGYFDLVIKVYPQGKMSQYLKALPEGKTIEVRGPLGQLHYTGNGGLTIMRKNPETGRESPKEYKKSKIGMIAGGTGITPCLQIIRDVIKHSKDKTEVSLIFANVTEDDILLRDELEACAKQNSNFHLYFTLDKPDEKWTQGKGFVNAEMIKAHLPPPSPESIILMCGPPPMMNFMEKNMKALDYPADNYYVYAA